MGGVTYSICSITKSTDLGKLRRFLFLILNIL
nr:MAG TPA: hypothetical protein [Caudoviricetes sp.]